MDKESDKPFKNRSTIEGDKVKASKRVKRYMQLAQNMALNSIYGKIRHGAVLVKGGSIINAAFNKDKFSAFGERFRQQGCGPATHHAELGCVLGIPRSVTAGADIYVCRVNRRGEFRNSKPCAMCHEVMRYVGIKRVYYTTSESTVNMYKL